MKFSRTYLSVANLHFDEEVATIMISMIDKDTNYTMKQN